MQGKDEVTAKQTCFQQFPEMLMKREQSFVRLGMTGQSSSALSQGEGRCIHHGIHRITSTFTLEIHSAKIVISPSRATGQKRSRAGIPLPFHNLKLWSTFCVTFVCKCHWKMRFATRKAGELLSVQEAINQLWPKQWSNSYWIYKSNI